MERVAKQGLIPVGSSSADFAAFQKAEIAKYGKIIKDANIKTN
jgi:tripartite-type tricarboxylate transporter receptor subunit TctC